MDKGARVVGILVFALGITILGFVFFTAYNMFTSPANQLLDGKDGAGLGSVLASVVVRILLLFIMTLAGSLIASRGIQLFLGGERKE